MPKPASLKQSKKNVLVTGASSIIGQPVCNELTAAGYPVLAVSRKISRTEHDVVSWDMVSGKGDELIVERINRKDGFDLVHCAPIWFLPKQIEWLASIGLRRIIVFSSSSIEGKSNSNSQHEQKVVKLLINAENDVLKACDIAGVDLTIFRPTMIYGHGKGQNLAFIAKVVQRFKFFPVASPANGLRQPVHANDLAKAVTHAIENEKTHAKIYTLAGAEALTYKEMVQRIFMAMGYRPRIISMNQFLYRSVLSLLGATAKLIGKPLPIDPAMIDRMQQNLDFDYSSATKDFGYSPNGFLPNGALDLIGSASPLRQRSQKESQT